MTMRAKSLRLGGWGRFPTARMDCYRPERVSEVAACLLAAPDGLVMRGAGRSYGDQALNEGGGAILTERLDRLLDFDPESGVLVAEPGVNFATLLRLFLPRGWLVPVSPGTGFATLGGAVANDVHGKNHDQSGSFGDHVRWIDLMLASGEVRRISPTEDRVLFRATIGGMGLTGAILAIAFAMVRVPGPAMEVTESRISDLDEFVARLADARKRASYSVGWIDALARGGALGRGILETAELTAEPAEPLAQRARRVPFDLPGLALNPLSVRQFNRFYQRRVPPTGRQRRIPVGQFLYPLDAIQDWNRIYGKRGFHQFQCVLPDDASAGGLKDLLATVSAAGSASFLAVLKTLGGAGRGMLSFPQAGYTLALDFPHRSGTGELLARLERITLDHGGRIYLAKDSALSPPGFATMYPEARAFAAVLEEVDPGHKFTSDMARRLAVRGTR